MMTIPTWFLILYLSSGQGIKQIIEVEGPLDCLMRSHFEMRFDPRVTSTYCGIAIGKIEV